MHLLVMIFQPEFVSDKLDVSGEDYLRPFAERGGNFQNRIGHKDKEAESKDHAGDTKRRTGKRNWIPENDQSRRAAY